MATQLVYDATHSFTAHLPSSYLSAGYVTGSSDIIWDERDWAAHPKAIRIDQSPIAGLWDTSADVDDYENGAVGLGQLALRVKGRVEAFKKGVRPGQREPLIYVSYDNVTAVVNALIAGGVESAGLWVARWGIGYTNALSMVANTSGPFPIKGVQYANGALYDVSVFDTGWINNVATTPAIPPKTSITAIPPGYWEFPVILIGKGIDGNVWSTTYNGKEWTPTVKL